MQEFIRLPENSNITIEEFVQLLWQRIAAASSPMQPKTMSDHFASDMVLEALRQGWLEPADFYEASEALDKRTAARISHQLLRLVLKEKDTNDWSAAKSLKDLYDCRTCVNHVAQVYCKGIMEAVNIGDLLFFDMRSPVTGGQAAHIVERIFTPALRLAPVSKSASS